MYCQKCGKEIDEAVKFCPHCGNPKKIEVPKTQTVTSSGRITEKLLMCPKCRSTQLTDGKKGFSAGKAVAGAVLTGGVGILAGAIGSNKTVITCLNCGHKFKPGEDYKNAIKKQKEQEEAMKSPVFWIVLIILMIPFFWLLSKCS